MKYKIFALGFLLTNLLLSCKNVKEESGTYNPEINTTETSQDLENEISTGDREVIIKKLQGDWKEPEYPFRVAQFNDTLVKFIEEGVVEEPEFQEYKISTACPFEVNNIKNVAPDDIILVLVEAGTCEKLQVSNNTLILSGFSVNTGSEYRIVYKKWNKA